MSNIDILRSDGIFYGWWIALSAMIVLSMGAGFYWLGFGVFFLPLAMEFNTNRTALSGAMSIAQLEGGLLGPIDGYLVDRFGPRRMMVIGVSIMGVGFILMSMVNSLLMFYVVYLKSQVVRKISLVVYQELLIYSKPGSQKNQLY